MTTLLLARWVAPIASPPIQHGAVVIENGVIRSVGPRKTVEPLHPGAQKQDLGSSLLMPGLVNAHTHLELSDLTPGPPQPLAAWLRRMLEQSANPARSIPRAVRLGVEQCIRFGVTSVADIARQHAIVRPILASSPLRIVSFAEITAMGQHRNQLESRLAAALTEVPGLRIGLEPHAPYSIEPSGYQRCVEVARSRALPLTTHLAESPDEARFLADFQGPFRDLWNTLPWIDDRIPRFSGGPIRLAASVGLLDHPTLLAHVNYCDDQELALLASGRASVVYCPRTHACFGHPPHRWRDMLAAGINVAVGTDSCASSPDLNLLDDLRLLHRLAPDLPPQQIIELATTRAARALGDPSVGAIAPGLRADLIAFPVAGPDPLAHLLESDTAPSRVWIGGQRLR